MEAVDLLGVDCPVLSYSGQPVPRPWNGAASFNVTLVWSMWAWEDLFLTGDFSCTGNHQVHRNHVEPHAASSHAIKLSLKRLVWLIWREVHVEDTEHTLVHNDKCFLIDLSCGFCCHLYNSDHGLWLLLQWVTHSHGLRCRQHTTAERAVMEGPFDICTLSFIKLSGLK